MAGTGILVFLSLFVFAQPAPRASAPAELAPLQFLVGTWEGAGGGGPGQGSGEFAFKRDVADKVIVRTNTADYPATKDQPATHHEDLMVIHVDAGKVRADYWDSEGHTIHYALTVRGTNDITFVSDVVASEPRYRLSYKLGPDGLLTGTFEGAPPGKPDAFAPYLSWSAKKKK